MNSDAKCLRCGRTPRELRKRPGGKMLLRCSVIRDGIPLHFDHHIWRDFDHHVWQAKRAA